MGTSNSALMAAVSSRKALPAVKRQHRSPELKRRIVEETLVAGASVARVARAHGVNANQVFAWRRQYRQGRLEPGSRTLSGLLAVRVAEGGAHPRGTENRRTPSGTIQIELPQGQLRLRGAVDTESTLRTERDAVYELTIAKGGPKFSESTSDGPLSTTQEKGVQIMQHVSMSELANEFSRGLGRPVIDSTGLKGRYEIRIDMAAIAEASHSGGVDAESAMITILQEQLGLRVRSGKDWVDVLVVDHAEKTPTEN